MILRTAETDFQSENTSAFQSDSTSDFQSDSASAFQSDNTTALNTLHEIDAHRNDALSFLNFRVPIVAWLVDSHKDWKRTANVKSIMLMRNGTRSMARDFSTGIESEELTSKQSCSSWNGARRNRIWSIWIVENQRHKNQHQDCKRTDNAKVIMLSTCYMNYGGSVSREFL